MEAIGEIHVERIPERVSALLAHDGMSRLLEAAGDHAIYLVGGAVRDILLGRGRADVDVVVEGDAVAVARALGEPVREHDRFRTATVLLGDLELDLVAARRETYPAPGALPEVVPATISEDLARRDFSINAMAVPLVGDPVLIDPHDGAHDLQRRRLRTLHADSMADDPTRAIRAARYMSRFGLDLEPQTEAGLLAADLGAVSADRVESELRKLAADERPDAAFALLADWGLLSFADGWPQTLAAAERLLADSAWSAGLDPSAARIAAVRPATVGVRALTVSRPERPSEIARLAAAHSPEDLLIARARGAEWIDRWVEGLRDVRLEIDGSDLLAAGVPEGPLVGRGLEAALGAKLDGEAAGRDSELAVALAAVSER